MCRVWGQVAGQATGQATGQAPYVLPKHTTSTQQASSLIEAIGNNIYSVKELMELMGLMGLKDRENFLNNHLNSSIANGYIEPFILKVQSIKGRNIA